MRFKPIGRVQGGIVKFGKGDPARPIAECHVVGPAHGLSFEQHRQHEPTRHFVDCNHVLTLKFFLAVRRFRARLPAKLARSGKMSTVMTYFVDKRTR
jgi:hypothetical protein